jgi:ferrous iron transport protein B
MVRKTVALLGNPNTGKSSLFNALCGMSARVGNYPGITVEKKVGTFQSSDGSISIDIVDLPGTYSLAARSADEAVTIDILCGLQPKEPKPDAVVVIVDATNLERNLYLLSQVIEVGIPTLLVFNMWDRVVAENHKIDVSALSERLGVTILCSTACDRKGTGEVKDAIQRLLQTQALPQTQLPRESFPAAFLDESVQLRETLRERGHDLPTLEVDRMIIDKDGHFQKKLQKAGIPIEELLHATRERLENAGCKVPLFETKSRYAWVRQKIEGLVERPPANRVTSSDRVDRWLTHRWVGMVVFLLLMFTVFQAITIFAKWPMDGLEEVQKSLQEGVEGVLAPGALRSLINDGVIAGIGAVVMFLPQIAILFLFIAILEDCGYMARAAFVVDKLMSSIGLSGKSFLPLMSSFACAVPGIMATRTIENTRDRMVTILIAPLMSCSARLPVYVLMVTAFVSPDAKYLGGWLTLQGIVLFAMHCVGAIVAIPAAWFLRKYFFAGQQGTFLLELHSYKWPSWNVLYQRVWERVWAFVARAGTLIFCTAILVWAACYFPASHQQLDKDQARLEELRSIQEKLNASLDTAATDSLQQEIDDNNLKIDQQVAIINQAKSEMVNNSFLGMAGKVIEPVVKPLGWDWKIGVATMASFPAREVIIATLGTIYSLGSEENEESDGLKDKMRSETWPDGRPVYSLATALSVMVFFALCAQCAATLMTIKRETNSWRWPIFSFVSMTTAAYVAAWVTYSVASWLGLGS